MYKSLAIIFALVVASQAQATEAYEYARQAIYSFASIKEATNNAVKTNIEARQVVMNVMQNAIKQKAAFSLANSMFKSYSNSKDEQIRQSAALISASLAMLQITSEQTATECEKILNQQPNAVVDNSGTFMKAIFEIGERANLAWKNYAMATTSISMALTGEGKNASDMTAEELNKPNSHIKITAQERELLKKQIIDNFGVGLKGDLNRLGMNSIGTALLYKFLNDKWITIGGK